MSLDFNYGQIANFKDVCFGEDGYMRPVTDALIWATMVVDMGKITAENAAEFWRRLNLYQHGLQPMLRKGGGAPRYITEQEVRDHIGLYTNVVTKTPAQWNRRFKDMLFNNAEDRVRAAKFAAERELATAGAGEG